LVLVGTYVGPRTTCGEKGEKEKQKVAGNLLDHMTAAKVPGHIDPKQLLT